MVSSQSDSTRHAKYLLPLSLPSFLPIFKVLRQNCRLLYIYSKQVQVFRGQGLVVNAKMEVGSFNFEQGLPLLETFANIL